MSIRRKTRAMLVSGLILVFVAALFIKFTVYDPFRLAWFAYRIAEADRIVATNWLRSVSLTITGDETKKVIKAISSAGSGRPPFGTDWANIYDVKARFYRGTKFLGELEMDCGDLFLIRHRPPFRDRTGLLHDLVYKPISEAAGAAEVKKVESQ